jgi:hypothetical protein
MLNIAGRRLVDEWQLVWEFAGMADTGKDMHCAANLRKGE